MGWRTVIVRERCQLSYKLDYLVIKRAEGSEQIYLDEIDCLIIESCATFLNSGLVEEFVRRKISVIFCDKRHNPAAQLLPLTGAYDSRRKIVSQLSWTEEAKNKLWTLIIKEKIAKQGEVLRELKMPASDYEKLFSLSAEVAPNDAGNCEAQAARYYFSRIFGAKFNRKDMEWTENAALNYGYAILLSTFNRCVVAGGYLTQLGIHHIGNENAFNLSCDLMEPFRPAVDRHIIKNELWDLDPTTKLGIVDVLNTQVIINSEKQYLANAISIYCKDCLDALGNHEVAGLKGYEF